MSPVGSLRESRRIYTSPKLQSVNVLVQIAHMLCFVNLAAVNRCIGGSHVYCLEEFLSIEVYFEK